ncbi:MAG: flagellar hook-associated protein FlgK [Planctomycetes bacterium]|nr:flagellar hook-associated protein FlgK [Planctomycetota bacterium]
MTFAMGLGATLRALSAARMGIQTASQNVANANVPGYSRQRLVLSATTPLSIQGLLVGSGVQVADLRRIVDEGLVGRIAAQEALYGSAATRYERLYELEGLFSDDGGGVAERMSELFGALGALQTDPGDRALRGGVVQAGEAFTSGLNLVAQRLADVGGSVFAEVQGLARSLEEKARIVADLNVEIVRLESGGGTANDLRDRRDQAIRELSELCDVRRADHASGSLDLLVGGRLLVAGRRVEPVSVARDAGGAARLTIGANRRVADVEGGRIGALLELQSSTAPQLLQRLDTFTRELILGFDRVHTTGTPGDGPFQSLVAGRTPRDTNGNGLLGDELLESLGLPFDIRGGELWVRIVDRDSGDHAQHRVAIDPTSTTLRELAAQLSALPHLTASVDTAGRLRLQADRGYGFDFAPTLDAVPDPDGLFGGSAPTVATAASGPFDLSSAGFPQTFTVDVDGVPEVVTLTAADFADPSRATAAELAAAIDADLTRARALVADGRLTLRATSAGAAATMTLADGAGAPLARLGLPVGDFDGQAHGVAVRIAGQYDGDGNRHFRFVAAGDGEIGVTAGLQVDVFDETGRRVATLDVGDGYDGGPLPVDEGIEVTFTQGRISRSANDAFALDALADPDTADLLVALGLNTFFLGSTAQDVRVNPDLVASPGRLAAARDGSSGNLLRLAELERMPSMALGGDDLAAYVAAIVADVGFETSRARSTLETQDALKTALEEQRLSVSGVDIDEEMLDLVAWQQSFEAASRMVAVVQQITDTLMNLGRP